MSYNEVKNMVKYFEDKRIPFKIGRYLAKSNEEAALGLNRTQATQTTKAYKKQGYNARMIKTVDGYTVWRSQNMASFYMMPRKTKK